MRITRKKISALKLDPDNVRTHDDRNIEAIARSLATFGIQNPIVITPDGTVIKGNGTLLAAKSLGWKEIPTVTTTLTGEHIQAYAIADNRTAELAAWDPEGLAAALEALEALGDHDGDDEGLRLAAGFSSMDLTKLRRAAGVADPSAPNTEGQGQRNEGDGDPDGGEDPAFRVIVGFTSRVAAEQHVEACRGADLSAELIEL